jgi:hypothetical protein
VLIVAVGTGYCFLINAVSFVAVIGVARVHTVSSAARCRWRGRGQIREGSATSGIADVPVEPPADGRRPARWRSTSR